MKKVICFLLMGFFFSCSNKYKKLESAAEAIEVSESYEDDIVLKELKLEDLTSKKLLDYYDLLQLKGKQPEFNADILEQLSAMSNGLLLETKDSANIAIGNIRQIGVIEQVSDSVQKIKLKYEIFFESSEKTDSVNAFVTTKTIRLDGMDTKSRKVIFSLIN